MNILIALMIILPAAGAVFGTVLLQKAYENYTDTNKIKKNEENDVRAKYYVLAVLPMLNVLYGLAIALIVNSYFTGAQISKNVGLPCVVLAVTLLLSTLISAFLVRRDINKGALRDTKLFGKTVIKVIALELVIVIGLFFLAGAILGVY